MTSTNDGEKYFLLPHEDGSTIIINRSKRGQEPEIHVVRSRYEEVISHDGQEMLEKYMEIFKEETKLKVALFEEMLRMMPVWLENTEPWNRELCSMAARSINIHKKLRTPQEEAVLEWLLLGVCEPKLTEVHQNSFEVLLELANEKEPLPSKAFLLEYSQCRTNDVSYGFMTASPGEVMSLVYNFGETGLGRCFSRDLRPALERLGDESFPLWGQVCPRYKCLLMLEFLSHPGVVPVEELQERSSWSGLLQNPGLHKIADTSQARILAILLFDSSVSLAPRSRSAAGLIIAGLWLVITFHAVYAFYRVRGRR